MPVTRICAVPSRSDRVELSPGDEIELTGRRSRARRLVRGPPGRLRPGGVRPARAARRAGARPDHRGHRHGSPGPTRSRSWSRRRTGSSRPARTRTPAAAVAATGSTPSCPPSARSRRPWSAQQLRRIARHRSAVDRGAAARDGPAIGAGARLADPGHVRGRARTAGRPAPHRSHHVVPIDDCLIAHPRIRDLGVTGRRWPRARSVEAATGTGGPERAVIVTGCRPPAGQDEIGAEPVLGQVRGRTTVFRGRAYLTQQAAGRTWRVSAGGFWQVHPGWRTPWSRRSWRRCSRSQATPRWTCTAGPGCSPGCWPRPSARTARWPGSRPTGRGPRRPPQPAGVRPGPPSTRATPAGCWPGMRPTCLRRGSRSPGPAPHRAGPRRHRLPEPPRPRARGPAAYRLRLL